MSVIKEYPFLSPKTWGMYVERYALLVLYALPPQKVENLPR
jgi:hypothetical protein